MKDKRILYLVSENASTSITSLYHTVIQHLRNVQQTIYQIPVISQPNSLSKHIGQPWSTGQMSI